MATGPEAETKGKQDLAARKAAKKKTKPPARIHIREAWCKGCRICVEFCPTEVLAMKGQVAVVVDIEACTKCGLCEQLCPDFAIQVE